MKCHVDIMSCRHKMKGCHGNHTQNYKINKRTSEIKGLFITLHQEYFVKLHHINHTTLFLNLKLLSNNHIAKPMAS